MSKISISNIAWTIENDFIIYKLMKEKGFSGLEIAPTRIFPENPYGSCIKAKSWVDSIRENYGFVVPSMQSIWYGHQEQLFGSDKERRVLISYTKKAIDFAEAIGCKNLVFGCPKNRNMPEGVDENIGIDFFKEVGDYAFEHNTVIGMEANPQIYNTNYINDTASVLELIEKVDSKGFLLDLDVGTMIANNESVTILTGKEHLINHVHISEPGLKVIEQREIHKQLAYLLRKYDYKKYVSIEVSRQDDIRNIEKMMNYVKDVFGDEK